MTRIGGDLYSNHWVGEFNLYPRRYLPSTFHLVNGNLGLGHRRGFSFYLNYFAARNSDVTFTRHAGTKASFRS
jgi:hypothetical protein